MRYRCEVCFRMNDDKEMVEVNGDHMCKIHAIRTMQALPRAKSHTIASDASSATNTTEHTHNVEVAPQVNAASAKARCERCYKLALLDFMVETPTEHICKACLEESMYQWYAVAVMGSEGQCRKNIMARFKGTELQKALKRVVIPKIKTEKITKSRFNVYAMPEDENGEETLIGEISATDHEEALFLAKQQYEKPQKKTVFKPDHHEDVFEKMERVQEGRKVYYQAISNTGRMMGRIQGVKSPKEAESKLKKLYGPKEKKGTNPREAKTKFYTVSRVEQTKQGGLVKEQNQKAMPGYIMIQAKMDDVLSAELKRVKGIYSLLPYNDPIDFDDLEDEDDLLPLPTPLDEDEVEKLNLRQRGNVMVTAPVDLNFKAGDKVKVDKGLMVGMVGEVISSKDGNVIVELKVMGTPTRPTFKAAELRKVG